MSAFRAAKRRGKANGRRVKRVRAWGTRLRQGFGGSAGAR